MRAVDQDGIEDDSMLRSPEEVLVPLAVKELAKLVQLWRMR